MAQAVDAPRWAHQFFSAFKNILLSEHNQLREEVGVVPLEWSEALSKEAMLRAEELSGLTGRRHPRPKPMDQGESVYCSMDVRLSPSEAASHCCKAFKSNKSAYTPGTPVDEINAQEAGEYLQMVWEGTEFLGASMAVGPNGLFLVCRYTPPGITQGEMPYQPVNKRSSGGISAKHEDIATSSAQAPMLPSDNCPTETRESSAVPDIQDSMQQISNTHATADDPSGEEFHSDVLESPTKGNQTEEALPPDAESTMPDETASGGRPGTFKDVILAEHNLLRAKFQVPLLKWCHNLESQASAYAKVLAALGRPERSAPVTRPRQAENVYHNSAARMTPLEAAACACHSFGCAELSSSSSSSSTNRLPATSQQSQIVWRGTTKMGAGMASSQSGTFVVCRYSPAAPPDVIFLPELKRSRSQPAVSRPLKLASFAEIMLDALNVLRLNVGVPPLAWSTRLEFQAKARARNLASQGKSPGTHAMPGETIYWCSTHRLLPEEVAGECCAAIRRESKFYVPGTAIPKGGNTKASNYTQAVWATTTSFAAAMAKTPKATVAICLYSPPGNHPGSMPYAVDDEWSETQTEPSVDSAEDDIPDSISSLATYYDIPSPSASISPPPERPMPTSSMPSPRTITPQPTTPPPATGSSQTSMSPAGARRNFPERSVNGHAIDDLNAQRHSTTNRRQFSPLYDPSPKSEASASRRAHSAPWLRPPSPGYAARPVSGYGRSTQPVAAFSAHPPATNMAPMVRPLPSVPSAIPFPFVHNATHEVPYFHRPHSSVIPSSLHW